MNTWIQLSIHIQQNIKVGWLGVGGCLHLATAPSFIVHVVVFIAQIIEANMSLMASIFVLILFIFSLMKKSIRRMKSRGKLWKQNGQQKKLQGRSNCISGNIPFLTLSLSIRQRFYKTKQPNQVSSKVLFSHSLWKRTHVLGSPIREPMVLFSEHELPPSPPGSVEW